MIENLLFFLTDLAVKTRFLMPIVMRLSIFYLRRKYGKAFLDGNREDRDYRLRHLASLRKKLHPSTESFIVNVKMWNEIQLQVNICQQYCGDMYYGIGFEEGELDLVRKFVQAGDIFFDVGANVGIYTLTASRFAGTGGEVHAFEPLAGTYQLLQKNVQMNGVKNIHLNNVAVGDMIGEADLYVNAQAALTGLGLTNRGVLLDVQKVPIWTLDEYAEREKIQSINFLKVDVEGFEGHVLRGAKRLISRSPDLIVMSELAQKNFEPLGFSTQEVIDYMCELGFEVWIIGDNGLSFIPVGETTYSSQNFFFIRRVSNKYALLEKIK